jgi:hypothetical protein
MKTSVVIALGLVASAEGFAPARQERSNTQLQATLFDRIFGLDLFAPVQDQNDYGARTKKEVRPCINTSNPCQNAKFFW